MKNNKGFTLVEILAVIVLISLIMIIIVPNVQKVAFNSKVKLCNSKITLVEEAINLWTKDNFKCYEKTGGCNVLSNCNTVNNEITCTTTFQKLAENSLINFDKTVENIKYVINPINNGNMNNTIINIKYNKTTKQATPYLSETDKLKICSKDADEITPAVIEKITEPSDDNNNFKAAELLEKLYNDNASSNGLEKDDTTDKNLRYVGSNPKNYIIFNNETWRIIGVFNVYNIESNKSERLVKIIRNEPLSTYSWDTSSTDINNGYGINEWNQAKLMTELNNDYLDTNKTSGTTLWYSGINNAKNIMYDYSKNIKGNAIDKIAKVRWNLGGSTTDSISALNMYNAERGTTHISNPSDGVERQDYWDGKIGLMYASDYGYASTDTTCRNNMFVGNNNSNNNCKLNNWLSNNTYKWTLTNYSVLAYSVLTVYSGGGVGSYSTNNSMYVHPTLFLKFDVAITGGTGTQSDPFTIETSSSFSKDSWQTIANNVKSGKSYIYNIGDEKEVEINGKNYTVRVANNTIPNECNGDDFSQTACGFVIEFVDIVEQKAMNSTNTNVGGWPASAMRTYVNGDFFNNLPEDLRNVIINTKVISSHGNTSGETNFTSTDKIYLLSGHEVYENGTSNQILAYDTAYNKTRQLDYYRIKGVTTKSYSETIKKYNNLDSSWWLRAATADYYASFLRVTAAGGWNVLNTSTTNGVAPAFRIG